MSDDRTKADKAWEAFNAATNAAEVTDEDDENYFAVLDQAATAAESAAAEITGASNVSTTRASPRVELLLLQAVDCHGRRKCQGRGSYHYEKRLYRRFCRFCHCCPLGQTQACGIFLNKSGTDGPTAFRQKLPLNAITAM